MTLLLLKGFPIFQTLDLHSFPCISLHECLYMCMDVALYDARNVYRLSIFDVSMFMSLMRENTSYIS